MYQQNHLCQVHSTTGLLCTSLPKLFLLKKNMHYCINIRELEGFILLLKQDIFTHEDKFKFDIFTCEDINHAICAIKFTTFKS